MTLKRRLFISNILMTFLPLVAIWAVVLVIALVLYGGRGLDFTMSEAEKEALMADWYTSGKGAVFWVLTMVAAVVLTIGISRLLTRTVIKRVTAALDALAAGARQFSENNLAFRLDYRADDEFRPVCDTFNDMAARLEAMIRERQRNDDSRWELIAGISHDLRTPLTAIKVGIDGITSGVAATDEQRAKYAAIIARKTVDLERIIDQLFLFSKLDLNEFTADTRVVNAAALVDDCVDELAGEYAQRGLVITAGDVPNDIAVSVDPGLFRRVILNVLENAVKYKTAAVGRLSIDCAVSDTRDDSGISNSDGTTNVDGTVEFRFTDDGPGVAPEALDKLFDVFYRADPSRAKQGSGLGLAISAKIVAKMGGTIRAELPAAGGLAIVIALPLVGSKG
jgi:signal transduction histidine kinase